MSVRNDKIYLVILLPFGKWDGMLEQVFARSFQHLRYDILINIP